ncbi:MAG: hypothetical protein D6793_00965 [Thermoflexia bacterium]|nr:MAG: hypothetical protein D6793_00965 [Thermoflexia bacterium]
MCIGLGVIVLFPFRPSPASPLAPHSPVSILFLVDHIDSPAPRLLGIWYVRQMPEDNRVFAAVVYPRNDARQEGIARRFSLDAGKEVNDALWEYLDTFLDVGERAYVVLDRYSLVLVLKALEPLRVQGASLDALAAVNTLVPPWEDPQASLQSQTALVKAICNRLADAGRPVSATSLLDTLHPPLAYLHPEDAFKAHLSTLLRAPVHCMTP